MFSAAVNRFVKSIGNDTLHEVPSLDLCDNAKLLQVVIKKNRRWFWQRASYKPTEFKLSQILTVTDEIEVPEKERKLVTYTRENRFAVKGKFGALLAKELLEVDLDADDEITLDVKFGDVLKTEDDIPKLIECLNSKKVDFHHPLVKQVQKDSRLVLCVIVGVVKLKNDGELHSQLKFDNEAEIKSKIGSVDAKVGIDDEKTKTFTIPAGTALAYNAYELLISKNGKIELIIVDGGSGGFGAKDDVDSSMQPADVPADEMFQGIYALTESDRAEFRVCMGRIMSAPKMVRPILSQLKKAYKAMSGEGPKTIFVAELIKAMPTTDDSLWRPLLLQADLTFKSDDTVVLYPEDKSVMLESYRNLFETLAELEDDELKLLRRLTASQAHGLIYLLRQTLFNKESLKKDNPDFAGLFADEPYAKSLLSELHYTLDGNNITAPSRNQDSLHATYMLVSALWE